MWKKAHSHLKDDLLAFDKFNSLSFEKKKSMNIKLFHQTIFNQEQHHNY